MQKKKHIPMIRSGKDSLNVIYQKMSDKCKKKKSFVNYHANWNFQNTSNNIK